MECDHELCGKGTRKTCSVGLSTNSSEEKERPSYSEAVLKHESHTFLERP